MGTAGLIFTEYLEALSWQRAFARHRSGTPQAGSLATNMRWPLRSGWSLGVLLIVIVAFIWNAASVLVQYIFTDYSFFRPFFLTYLANSLFVVTLPLRSLSQLVRGCSTSHKPCHRVAATEAQGDGGCATDCAGGSADLRVTARAALVVCPLWFLANFRRAAPPHRRRTAAPPHRRTAAPPHRRRTMYRRCLSPHSASHGSYNWSLGLTSVSSSTVISSSSAAWTLLLSVGLLGEHLTLTKLLGVLLCWAGNALTVMGDGDGGGDGGGSVPAPPAAPPSAAMAQPLLGDSLCLFSSLMYACYTVAIRYYAPQDMALFFGLLGR